MTDPWDMPTISAAFQRAGILGPVLAMKGMGMISK